MTIELSEEELQQIGSWYSSAAFESATGRDESMFQLLEKLNIEAEDSDLWLDKPENWVESHRPIVIASNAAITAYKERHPERQ